EDGGLMAGEGGELVGRRGEGEPRPLGDARRETGGELTMGIEAGADGRASLGEREKARQGRTDLVRGERDLRRIAGEFLAEGNGRRILKVGPADLDDSGELPGLGVDGRAE